MRLFWQCGACTECFCLETDFVESVLLRLCNLEECRVFIVEDNILVNSIISYHWQLVGYYYRKPLFSFGSFLEQRQHLWKNTFWGHTNFYLSMWALLYLSREKFSCALYFPLYWPGPFNT